MKFTEKQEIAEVAKRLIQLLSSCDDLVFVDTVISCVQDGDEASLDLDYL